MIGHIYYIRNSFNGKGYVGQTRTSIVKRFGQHKIDARNNADCPLYHAIRKYGVENFAVHWIASCNAGPFLNELERHYIKRFDTFYRGGGGYNATEGGSGSAGCVASEATRIKMSLAKKGRKRGPFSEEHRSRMAVAKLGNKNGKGGKGRVPSESTRAKISASRKLRFEQKAASAII